MNTDFHGCVTQAKPKFIRYDQSCHNADVYFRVQAGTAIPQIFPVMKEISNDKVTHAISTRLPHLNRTPYRGL